MDDWRGSRGGGRACQNQSLQSPFCASLYPPLSLTQYNRTGPQNMARDEEPVHLLFSLSSTVVLHPSILHPSILKQRNRQEQETDGVCRRPTQSRSVISTYSSYLACTYIRIYPANPIPVSFTGPAGTTSLYRNCSLQEINNVKLTPSLCTSSSL